MPEGALQQRVAVITGAAGGLGREYARHFAGEGARLVLADVAAAGRPDSPLDELCSEIVANGGQAVAHHGDIGEERTSDELVELAVATYGALDVLINNAGNWYEGELVDSQLSAWDSIHRTHLRGSFLSTRAAGRFWRSQQQAGAPVAAAIVNTSSRSALSAIPTHGVYAAAKAGVATMTQIAAKELQPHGVRVNCVVPAARTPMAAQVTLMRSQLDGEIDSSAFDPLDPANVAPLVAYLATRECSLTGQVLFCRGGTIEVYAPWTPHSTLENDGSWTVAELGARLPDRLAGDEWGSTMIVLDAQVHSWYSDRPDRPWAPGYRPSLVSKPSYLQHAGQTNSPDMVLAEMAAVGVDGALLVPIGVYGTDVELELEASESHPDRFQTIGLIDHLDPQLADHLEKAAARGLRGVRILEMREPDRVARHEFDPALRLCAELGLVVTLSLAHPLDPQLPSLFRRNPDVFFYIDHLGTGYAPPILGYRPDQPFEHLPAVLDLAHLGNVGIKLTGAPALSYEPYPFRDIWQPALQLIRTFGADRVSWGSDFSRTNALHSYWEGRYYLTELSGLADEELALVYGQTLIDRTGWNPQPVDQTTR